MDSINPRLAHLDFSACTSGFGCLLLSSAYGPLLVRCIIPSLVLSSNLRNVSR